MTGLQIECKTKSRLDLGHHGRRYVAQLALQPWFDQ